MLYHLNSQFSFIEDASKKLSYVLSRRGGVSVINSDAMVLLQQCQSGLISQDRYRDFFNTALAKQWIVSENQLPAVVRNIDTPYHLKRVQFELCLKCNLQCAHCYCTSGPAAPKGLPTDTVFNLIDQCADLGVLFFDITGGEPLLRKDIFSIVDYAQKRGIVTSLFTNGTIINEYNAKRLAELKIASVQTSLDAITPSLHDNFRGLQGAFEKTVRGIRLLKKYRVPISVTVMVHRKNQYELQSLCDFLETDLCVPYRLDRVIPAGRASADEENSLSNSEFFSLVRNLSTKKRIDTTKICDGASALIDKGSIEPFCGVGISYVFIKHNRDVVLCPTMTGAESPAFKTSNFLISSLKEIWLHHSTFAQFRGIQCENIKTCEAAENCRGGCRSNAYLLYGAINSPDELYCNIHKNNDNTYVPFIQIYRKKMRFS